MTNMTDTHAPALDAGTVHLVVEHLIARMADAVVDDPLDAVMQSIRATQMGHKLLTDVEARNLDLAARDTADGWTRLATMKPFHPDDQTHLERVMARHREVVLEQGRRQGRLEAQGNGDAN